MKIIGIIPARMGASRFPGKPLHKIIDRPMLAHVYDRAKLYNKWDYLGIATCDDKIKEYAIESNYNCIMTSINHTRALDRVAEAVTKIKNLHIDDEDIIINVQGDEPMLHPEMFTALLLPILENDYIDCTILAMLIAEEKIWRNPDTVKIINNSDGKILYTTRAAAPYNNNVFNDSIKSHRIYGLFAFKWKYLKLFTEHPETDLERLESCDSNRILDMPFSQYIAPYPYLKSYSVDSLQDIELVEANIINDKYWLKY
jgi:3-deoxy-manno-octulosonate cytidylyltransferase (CMP-KDO synthetase)